MGSSSSSDDEHHSKKKEKSKPHAAPSADHQHPPPGYPPHAAYGPYPGYPPPPQPGYPGHPPHGYNTYPYAQAPPAAYYYQARRREQNSCAGCILSFLIMVILLMCLSSIITWLVLHPQMPRFQLEKFSVSDFVANDTRFSGVWDADMGVDNPNHKLRLHFERVQSGVIYNEDFVSMALVNPFFLNTEAKTTIKVAMATNNSLSGSLMNDIARDRKSGSVTFTLRVDAVTTFTSMWWTRQAVLRVMCEDLKVGFSGGSGSGSWTEKGPKECLLYV